MPVAANALVDLDTAKAYLNITGVADNAKVELTIDRASDWIEGWCQRPFKTVTYSDLRLQIRNRYRFFVAHAPIVTAQAVTITIGTTVQTVWRTEADGDPALKDVIVARSVERGLFQPDHLYRAQGWDQDGASNPYNLLLGYTGGFAVIPDDLQEACLLCVQKIFREQARQLAELATVSLPGGGVTLFDRAMPARARELLMPYRGTVAA